MLPEICCWIKASKFIANQISIFLAFAPKSMTSFHRGNILSAWARARVKTLDFQRGKRRAGKRKTGIDVLAYLASAYFQFIPGKEPEPKVDAAEKLPLASSTPVRRCCRGERTC